MAKTTCRLLLLIKFMYVGERRFGVCHLKNNFVILVICRPESRFLELIPREESEDLDSAIPRLILKRQNTPSDDSTPPKVKYFLNFINMPQNISRLVCVILSAWYISYFPAGRSVLVHGPYSRSRAECFSDMDPPRPTKNVSIFSLRYCFESNSCGQY